MLETKYDFLEKLKDLMSCYNVCLRFIPNRDGDGTDYSFEGDGWSIHLPGLGSIRVDSSDAPEGYIAVGQALGLGCTGCQLRHEYMAHCWPCTVPKRGDGCDVIFIKKEK